MFVSCLCRVRQRDFTQLHALCVSMCIYVYAHMYAICMRYACGSAGTFTLPLSRQRGGTWACLYVGGDGLPDCSALEFVGVRVRVGRSLSGGPCLRSCGRAALRSCGPAGVVCAVMLSAMHAHDLARLRTTYVCRCASRCVSRCHARGGDGGLAMEAWRWRLGAGGLALEASWPVAVRRRALGAMLQCSTSACRSWRCSWRGVARRGSAWHVAWRVSAVQALGAAGLKRGAGLTLKMKTRVDARLLVAPRGATCWYGSTHASYGVSFSTEHKPHELDELA